MDRQPKPWLDMETRPLVRGDISYKTYARIMRLGHGAARLHCHDLHEAKWAERMAQTDDPHDALTYAESFAFRSRESMEGNMAPYWFLTAEGFRELQERSGQGIKKRR